MAYRKVRFAPLVIDGVGDPKIATGVYTVALLKRAPFETLGQLQDTATDEFKVNLKGAAVEVDLPVVQASDKNCLVIRGYLKPKGSYPAKQTSVDYVLVPAGAASSVVKFEDLPRVDPDTLLEVAAVPPPAYLVRLAAAEAAIAQLAAGGLPGGTLDTGDLTDITEPGKTAITVTGADLAARRAAFLAAIGAAPLASPAMTGDPTVPTPAAGDNDKSVANTEWVRARLQGITAGAVAFEGITGSPSENAALDAILDALTAVDVSLDHRLDLVEAGASTTAQVLNWTAGNLSTNGTSYGTYDTARAVHYFYGSRDPKIAGYTLKAGDRWYEPIAVESGGVNITINDTELTYTSGWQLGGDPNNYSSNDHFATVAGEVATWTWTSLANGTATLVCKKAPHHGIMQVKLDGGTAVAVDLYAVTETYQVEVWNSGPLSAGEHTITVTSTASKNTAGTGTVAEIDAIKLTAAATGTSGTNPNPNPTPTDPPPSTPTGFLKRVGDRLQLNGSNYRGVGVNMPWWNGCGAEIGKTPTLAQQQTMFSQAAPNSLYRYFLFGGWDLAKFDQILEAARPYGHRFILTLSDNMNGCGERYCGPNPNAFFSGGWQTGGWKDQWLTPVVQRYKNEPLVGMWEWTNEPPLNQTFRNFLDAVGAYVRGTLGDTHLISTGCMSAYGNDTGARLLNASPYIDVASMHEYDYNQAPSGWTARDGANAAAAGKPFIVGESGITAAQLAPGTARANQIKAKINALKTGYPSCVGFMYWSGAAPAGSYLSNTGSMEIPITGSAEIAAINTTTLL